MEFERWHCCLFHAYCWREWWRNGVSMRVFYYRRGWSVPVVPSWLAGPYRGEVDK